MRRSLFPLLAAAVPAAVLALASAPASANELRAEARAGVLWMPGDTKAAAGVAAGYDFDLGPVAFSGVEISADKPLESNARTAVGFTGRLGAQFIGTRVFAAGGYTTKPCDLCKDAWHTGIGAEMPFLIKAYGKLEYRHYYTSNAPDSNALVAGIGIRF